MRSTSGFGLECRWGRGSGAGWRLSPTGWRTAGEARQGVSSCIHIYAHTPESQEKKNISSQSSNTEPDLPQKDGSWFTLLGGALSLADRTWRKVPSLGGRDPAFPCRSHTCIASSHLLQNRPQCILKARCPLALVSLWPTAQSPNAREEFL